MYRWVEHTGELELHLEGDSLSELFGEALAAYSELAGEGEGAAPAGETVPREVELRAPDREALLADWLSELVFLGESESLRPLRAADLSLGEGGLRATVEAVQERVRPLVKAVTYHGLSVEEEGGRWRARLVLDV
jgi:SHS2 domain-containing protein